MIKVNIITKYTYRSLIKNKTRTIVTVLGIIVSVAMFTAVTEAIASARSFLIEFFTETSGAYHAVATHVPSENMEYIKSHDDVESSCAMYNIGYGSISSDNTYKPYLFVTSVSGDITDFLAVNITDGRMPQNSSEIMLPNHLLTNGNVIIKLGDTLNITLGDRMYEGQVLTQNDALCGEGEYLTDKLQRTYTVVGFFDRLPYELEPYSAPGYTAMTTGETGESGSLFFKFKNIRTAYDTVDELFDSYGPITVNRDLLILNGVASSNAVTEMVLGFAAVLFGLIMFGSISLIYNSFSISVSERTKQFGILKSIGATRRQIKKAVIREALMLCAVAVPIGIICGCVGIGITLWFLKDSFSGFIGAQTDIQMTLTLSPAALIIAALISVITALISAYIPARRAVKIPALEAVRQSGDIAIKSYKNKSYRITRKLFGVEGMIGAKNFRRNKRRYRAAVLSLFMSVVLFISASSFCAYLVDAAGTVPSEMGEDVVLSYGENVQMTDALYDAIMTEPAADSAAVSQYEYFENRFTKDQLSEQYIKSFIVTGKTETVYYDIVCVNDEVYYQFAKENGITATGNAIVYDKGRITDEDGKITQYSTFKDGLTELSASVAREIEGYSLYREEDGMFYYGKDTDDGYIQNGSEDIVLSQSEACTTVTYKIDGYTDTMPWFGTDNKIMLVYPLSRASDVFTSERNYEVFYFLAENHRACYTALERTMKNAGYAIGKDYYMMDMAEEEASTRAMITVIKVFSYGFIILISLIALANVFNTITTNIYLRRRELAMLRSVGMSKHGFNKMMNYECIICGFRGLALGLPVAFFVTFLIYLVTTNGYMSQFFLPWTSVAIAVISVFMIVFSAMFYSMHKLRKENTVDTLRNENI